MWTEAHPRFQGRHYAIDGARCDPPPRQRPHPPIWIGGEGDRVHRLAARAAGEAAIGSRFVIVSDFADPAAALAAAVKRLRARGDVILVWVFDTMEVRLPPPARYPLSDGREHLVLDTASSAVRAAHAREVAARCERLARVAAQTGAQCHAVRTGEELFTALERPFAERPEG